MEFNPYSADFRHDPYPVYRVLRDEHPAHFSSELGFWALSRYDDIVAALQEVETSSSTGALSVGAPKQVLDPIPMMMLLARLPDLHVDAAAGERLGGGVVRGWADLPVEFTPA